MSEIQVISTLFTSCLSRFLNINSLTTRLLDEMRWSNDVLPGTFKKRAFVNEKMISY